MESPDVAKLEKEIRHLKKQVERLEASRATFELMVDRNDKLLSRQLEQMQHQAEEFNTLANSIAQFAWMADAAGSIFWYNQRWYDYTGTTLEDMQGWGWQRVHHPDEIDRVVRSIQHAFTTGEPWEDTFPLRSKDGEYRWFLSRALPIRDAEGRVVRWFGTNTDVTEQRQMEQALQRQTEELNRINLLADSALDLANAGHWHFPLDDSGYYLPSERAARILGELPNPDRRYRLDEWAERVRAGDEAIAKTTAENFAAAIAGTIPVYDATYPYKRPIDGRLVWIHARGHVVKDADGKPTDMYGVIQDITAFKQQETDLRLALQKSDDATRAKSAFLANMSHEIRTPMNGILGMTELALDTELTAEQRDYLVTVKSSADALLSLINDILDFSKIEAGRIELDAVEFLLRDSIGDTLSPLALRAAAKGIELAYDVRPGMPDALIGDVYRLRQVLVNLTGNAIKFTDRGEVVITVSLKERSGDDVLLEVGVRDTGIGIAPEAAARLFKAFEQAEASTTRKYGGTGLGLAISKQLVELMGGEIRLESTPGAGSTFIFTVRLKAGVPRASATPEDAAQALAGKVALIVDDNETNRRIVGTMLGQWGLRVMEADSAKAGLAMLDRASSAAQTVSLIVSDLHMPEMDGFEFITAVRAHPVFSAVTVIMLTSSASPGDQVRCTELGVATRLLKPVKQSLLLDNVMRVMGASDTARSAAPTKAPAGTGMGGGGRSLKVLLAEDNPVNQKFAIKVLEGAGHTVTVANNGREAVEHTASTSFDVVLMDVQMPEMDGLDATRAIRARETPGGARLPIIAMTANAMKGDREMCLGAGMDGYVAKPVKRDLLFAEVARVLSGGPMVPAIDEEAPPVVLLVDDQPIVAKTIQHMLAAVDGLQFHHCADPNEAVATAARVAPSVILQDLVMPGVDGLDLILAYRAHPSTAQTPLVVLSSEEEPVTKAEAFRRGANDYLVKPPHRAELIARIQYHSRTYRLLLKARAFNEAEKQRLVAERQADALRARNTLIFGLAKLAESRDSDTGEHLERIAAYCRVLAEQLRAAHTLTDEWILNLQLASSLHDIGKVGIPDSVLLKPGPLTAEERAVIERHPGIGAAALDAILARDQGDPLMRTARNIAASHHERWDGKGYPAGLSGEAIPLEARIVSVADVYDALTSKRVYKPALTHDEALGIITRGRGQQFDPQVVDALLSCEIVFRHAGLFLHADDPPDGASPPVPSVA